MRQGMGHAAHFAQVDLVALGLSAGSLKAPRHRLFASVAFHHAHTGEALLRAVG